MVRQWRVQYTRRGTDVQHASIDFSWGFWYDTLPCPIYTFESAKLLATSTSAVEWYKSRGHISFLSKVIQIFICVNSTWTRYSAKYWWSGNEEWWLRITTDDQCGQEHWCIIYKKSGQSWCLMKSWRIFMLEKFLPFNPIVNSINIKWPILHHGVR